MVNSRIVIGMSGASGAIYGIRLLQRLKEMKIETHLALSTWAKKTIEYETDFTVEEICKLAAVYHSNQDLGAAISSGSFQHMGMVLVPCSMKSVSAIANGYSDELIHRAADVCIKEKRKLIIVPRESPLSTIHLRNLLSLSELGVTIMPPMPAMYQKPQKIEDIIEHLINRILDHLGLNDEKREVKRWAGLENN